MASSDAAHYIDLRALIDEQWGERYRSLLILADDARERSQQARGLAESIGAHYLSLLGHFEARPELCAHIDRFGIDELEALLLDLDVAQEVVVVDAIDVLLDTWRDEQRASFVWMLLGKRLDTYERGAKLFVFFALEDVYLRQHQLVSTAGSSRVLKLSVVSF